MNFPHTILRDGEAGATGGGGTGTATATAATGAATTGGASTAATGAGATGAASTAATAATGDKTAAAAATTTAPDPFWKGLYGEDGKINKAALDRLPDDLKPAKDWIAKYDNIGALLYGGHNANIVASKKALAPLEANAPDHVKAERKALLDGVNNVPKEPKGYGVAKPQDFPEQFWNQAGADKMAALAHKHSVPPDAVKELLGLQIELTNAELAKGKEIETTYFKEQDALFAKGAQQAGVSPDKAAEMVTRGAATLGIDPKNPILKNGEVRLAMMKMTTLVAEDRLVNGDAAKTAGTNFHERARDIINNSQNPEHAAYHDPLHPNNEKVRETVRKLYRQNGQQSRGEKIEQ